MHTYSISIGIESMPLITVKFIFLEQTVCSEHSDSEDHCSELTEGGAQRKHPKI